MDKFRKIFGNKKTSILGMIHLNPLPGTPFYISGTYNEIIEKARHEANIYKESKIVSSTLISHKHINTFTFF